MENQKRIIFISIFITIFVLITYFWISILFSVLAEEEKSLSIHFLNVGQGDSTFIETEDGFQVLIDGGRGVSVIRELSKIMDKNDRSIDVVIGTHFDADHVGGLHSVLDRYSVGEFIIPANAPKKSTAEKLANKLEEKNIKAIEIDGAYSFSFSSISFHILWPLIDVSETNASSIVLVVESGDAGAFLSGDAPESVEDMVVDVFSSKDFLNDIEVLKVGHHGSKTSTGDKLIKRINPKYAVISAGENNSYGHPHERVLGTLNKFGLKVYETKDGIVSFVSVNGKDFTPVK